MVVWTVHSGIELDVLLELLEVEEEEVGVVEEVEEDDVGVVDEVEEDEVGVVDEVEVGAVVDVELLVVLELVLLVLDEVVADVGYVNVSGNTCSAVSGASGSPMKHAAPTTYAGPAGKPLSTSYSGGASIT
jgi:hypothetical protein